MRLWKRKGETETPARSAVIEAEADRLPTEPSPSRPSFGVIEDPVLAQCIWRTLGTALVDRHAITADQMGKLTELDLHDAPVANLAGLQYAINLRSLDVDCIPEPGALGPIAAIPNLRTLTLRQWSGDLSRDLDGLCTLTELYLHGSSASVTEMPDSLRWVHELPELTALSLSKCYVELAPLRDLTKLRELQLSSVYARDPQTLTELPELTTLRVVGCSWLRDLSPVGHMPKLSTLELEELDGITDLTPLRGLSKLTTLKIIRLDNVQDLSPVGELPHLTDLTLHGPILPKSYGGDPHLISLAVVDRLTGLKALSLKGWDWRCREFPTLTALSGLEALELWDVPLQDADAIGSLGHLTRLSLWELPHLKDGRSLSALTELVKLNLFDVPLASLSPLSELTGLIDLAVGYSVRRRESATADLNLTPLAQLERLSLHGMPMHSLYPLRHLQSLTDIHLSELPATDVESLSYLENLRRLSVRDLEIESLEVIARLRHLTSVDLWSLPIHSIAPLGELINLTYVGLLFLKNVNDLSALSKLKTLTDVELSGLDGVSDLSPLAELEHLTSLRVGWMPQIDLSAIPDVPRVTK